MTENRAAVGACFHRTFPPALVKDFARRLDEGGADQLWIVEDCFYTGGVSLAASALAVTDRLTVGLGVLPAVSRTAAVTAMEIATLCELAPGRVLAGIGHGVQSWMGQMGVRPRSPLTALDEVMTAVRRLLAGEEVSVEGDYVRLDHVQLDHPPVQPPPLLAGVMGPKSLTLAGRIADGLVLAEPATPSYVLQSLDQAGRRAGFDVATFTMMRVERDRADAYRAMAPWLASLLGPHMNAGLLRPMPFFEELTKRYAERGVDGLATMPADWWREIGAIGSLDDAFQHIANLEAAGVSSIGLWPAPEAVTATTQLDDILRLAAR
jgi:5,10-methylenetetrahydromethanopterin reductase